jgi:membrane peptidoglycan carboxypeptidase
VQEVRDRDGRVVLTGGSEGVRVFDEDVARQMNDVLQTVVTGGTGTRARLPGQEVAGKTGTAQNWEDAWFVGYTERLSTAVWMGSPLGKVSMRNVGGIKVFGGTYPARVFGQFMKTAMAGRPALSFPAPDPKQIGNKQMHLSPSATTGVTEVQIGDPGVTIYDPGFPTNEPPGRPPRNPPPSQPPPSEPGCQEPENWPDDYPPFCS